MSGDVSSLYADAGPRLLRAVVLLTGNREDAEDAVQEAFLRASQRWLSVSALEDPEGWVRRVAINVAIDQARRRKRFWRLQHRLAGPASASATDAASVDVARAVQRLPRPQQQAVVLHYLCDLDVPAIAAALDRPVSTVTTQLARARQRLAPLLALAEEVGQLD